MEIKFTKEQYENLIKLVCLGNWMINGIRSDNSEDKQIKKFNDIEQYIFSFAKEFGLECHIEYDDEFRRFFPTVEFEESLEMEKYKDDYDNEVFWTELSDRLGERDFFRYYSKEEIKKMNRDQRFLNLEEYVVRYEEELFANGIDRLKIEDNK